MAGLPNAAFERLMATIKCEDVAAIPVGRSRFAKIDHADIHLVSRHIWWFSGRYAYTKVDGVIILMHRLIMGSHPDKPWVDHEDGDGLNNQRYNLRFCTPIENMRNKSKSRGVSRFKGVCFQDGGWRARIGVGGKKINLGSFAKETDAAKAYDKAALTLYGEFAKTNKQLGFY